MPAPESYELIGRARYMRSDGENADRCKCCEGAHVFGHRLEPISWSPGLSVMEPPDVMELLDRFMHQEGVEGKRVRVTVDLLPGDRP